MLLPQYKGQVHLPKQMLTGLPVITWQHLRFVYKSLPVKHLRKILAEDLEEEITASYILAFYPSHEARKNGKFYEVKIQVPEGLKIKQNRNGYQLQR